ncbi:MAG: hypothetical protein WBA63_08610 [Thermomicrobiales bacterium]
MADAYLRAGFRVPAVQVLDAPLRMRSAEECVQFERESFGALHQTLAGLSESERRAAWQEIEEALLTFEGPNGFDAPCQLLIGAAAK